jgi:hypothetical protein
VNGYPIGTAGNQQDDPRFGDIRICAEPLSGGQLGVRILPPPFNGGTNAGDIILNAGAGCDLRKLNSRSLEPFK